jgi:hypothetical protein
MQIYNATKSFLIGSSGTYTMGSIKIVFENTLEEHFPMVRFKNIFLDRVGLTLQTIPRSRTYRVLNMIYPHIVLHELGHLIGHKIFNRNAHCKITIKSSLDGIYGNFESAVKNKNKIAKTVERISGPLLDIIFSISTIALVKMFSASLPTIVLIGVVTYPALHITKEISSALLPFNTFKSCISGVSKLGTRYLIAANAVLVATTVLGLKLAYNVG